MQSGEATWRRWLCAPGKPSILATNRLVRAGLPSASRPSDVPNRTRTASRSAGTRFSQTSSYPAAYSMATDMLRGAPERFRLARPRAHYAGAEELPATTTELPATTTNKTTRGDTTDEQT